MSKAVLEVSLSQDGSARPRAGAHGGRRRTPARVAVRAARRRRLDGRGPSGRLLRRHDEQA
jgi:hypothetical protein